jgi:pyridoxine 4-dehydrogenase
MFNTIQLENFTLLRMGLGTNRIRNSSEAHELLRFACEQGINFYDTANIYQDGESELSIAVALKPYSKHLCITTKGGFKKQPSGVYKPEGHPLKLKQNLEASLVHLGLDKIDLYQLHRIDPEVPMEESLGALKELQIEGKIRHIGLSEVSVLQLKKAQSIVQVVSVQNRYNVFERDHDAVIDYCTEEGIVFIPFFPLGSSRHLFPESMMQVLNIIAKQYNHTPQQVALAWLLNRSPYILPIPGTLSKQHVLDNIAALFLELSSQDLKKIEECKAFTEEALLV